MAASVSYFRSLPLGYRPLVLDQLRSMGGTRFFVSLNDRPLEMRALPDTPNKQAVLEIVRTCCINAWARRSSLQVEFVSPDEPAPVQRRAEARRACRVPGRTTR